MMSKLGVLLTICLLLFPLSVLPLDGDQLADQPARHAQSAERNARFHPVKRCCPFPMCYQVPHCPCCG
uniref:Conotoxin reg3.8 n=1 Tax=Conus regius TaxID=101314 RepID=CM38_CONRE